MFSLPLGIEEKKGDNPDLDVNSSEIDYGVINYFLPKNLLRQSTRLSDTTLTSTALGLLKILGPRNECWIFFP